VSLPRWVDARWNTRRENEAYVILHWSARSRGYKRRERESERAREREREFGLEVSCLSLPPLCLSYSACLSSLAPFLRPSLRVPRLRALGRPWTSPFIDTRRCPVVQLGCSYVLTWLGEECLEPCTRANVAIGEALEPRRSIADGAARGPADVSLLP
jgi:hypothetical protein